jgi:hypothetical protein
MAKVRLVLRFRELTSGVDTVADHDSIVRQQGYVWWGWWKKQTEPPRTEDIRMLRNWLASLGEFDAWLIDTSAERMHRATIEQIHLGQLPEQEQSHVPEYYREAHDVEAWFKINKIQFNVPYEPSIETSIGRDTLTTFTDDTP